MRVVPSTPLDASLSTLEPLLPERLPFFVPAASIILPGGGTHHAGAKRTKPSALIGQAGFQAISQA
jgi:hypothetical protein